MSEITNDMINAIDTSSVLSFLAENINLYNWYLLRKENPNCNNCTIYDETDNTLTKVRDLLFKRAEENNEVCIQLKNAVLKLKLTYENENNAQNSYLLTDYIQTRQCDLYNYNTYPEIECVLWSEVKYTTSPEALYVKLNKLEDIYTRILSYNDAALRQMCYNFSQYYDCEDYSYTIPDYYMEEEQEEPAEEEAVFPALKIVDTNIIMEFDCPICFEAQTTGDKCVTTTCGHQYCKPCFEGMTQYKAVCAMCRGEISEYIVSIVV